MKYSIVVLTLAALMSPALADCELIATGRNDRGIFRCDLPPAPSAPPTCKMILDTLICDGEIGQARAPSSVVAPRNCGYSRRGAYVCW